MRTGKLLIASLTGVIIIVGIVFLLLRNQAETPLAPSELLTSPPSSVSTSPQQASCPDFHEGEITAGETRLTVAVAATKKEKVQGLSGCDELPENAGMLFPYESPGPVAFWMKDMLMPIDIVWIRDGHVIGIEQNLPAPAPGAAEKELLQYASPGPIDHVLEIKAGGAEDYGIELGSAISQRD